MGKNAFLQPGTHLLKIESGGFLWHTHVHVPAAWDGLPAPLVLLLHGAGGGGRLYLERTGWARKADEQGFIVAAPDGLPMHPDKLPNFLSNPRLWQSGQLRTTPRAQVDDLKFFKQLLEELPRRLPLDQPRIYVTGHSNGGGMAFRLAAEMSEHFAALAPVGTVCWVAAALPRRTVPTFYLTGDADPLVPIAGGEIKLPWFPIRPSPPVMESLQRWAVAIGCRPEPQPVRGPAHVRAFEFEPASNGAKFTAWFIEGQGHNWPGGKPLLPEMTMGPDVPHVNATEVIWDFFVRHTPSRGG